MKRFILVLSLISFNFINAQEGMNMSIGQHYMQLIYDLKDNKSITDNGHKLFASDIEFVINSRHVSNTADDLLKQMHDVLQEEGITNVKLLRTYELLNEKISIVHFEISYNDGVTEVVVTALTYDDDNKITKGDCVYGEKGCYEWKKQS